MPTRTSDTKSSPTSGRQGRMSQLLEELRGTRSDTSPGFAIGVYAHGEPVFTAGVGSANLELAVPITPSSVFHVASVSKQFTARCIAMLIEDGAIDPDDDVRSIMPELPDYGEPIRIRHLVFHTSGLRDDLWLQDFAGWADDAWISEADTLDLICRQQALSVPTGSQHVYSNAGYSLLALIVERVSGLPFARFAQERIFAPLGMCRSRFARQRGEIVPDRAAAYDLGPDGAYRTLAPEVGRSGAIGLLTTVDDFAHWEAHLRDEIGRGSLFGRWVTSPGSLDNGDPIPYAWGFFTSPHRDHRVIRHGGSHGGYRAHMLVLVDRAYSVACFANHSDANPGQICETVVDLLLGTTETSPAHHAVAWPVSDDAPHPGVYHDDDWGVWMHLRRDGDSLLLDDVQPRPLTRLDDGRYEAAPGGIPVRLAVDPAETTSSSLLVWVGSSDAPDRYDRVPNRVPDPPELAEFCGRYWSDELGVHYTIGLAPDRRRLLLTRRGHAPSALLATGDDHFCAGFMVNQIALAFARDRDRSVTGFTLSSLRTRNIRFVRAPPGIGWRGTTTSLPA